MARRGPQHFTTVPTEVEAMQFLGWQNAMDIFIWCKKVFYVGRGFEHQLRNDHEFDRSNGHLLEDAKEFLALECGDDYIRVNVFEWIVKDQLGRFSKSAVGDFEAEYVLVKEETPLVRDVGGH